MTTANNGAQKAFRRALLFSFVLHFSLVVIMAASGSFSRPEKKGMIHYVNFLGGPGGGGGGQGTGGAPGGGGVTAVQAPRTAAPVPAKTVKKESLRDLTVPSKVKAEPQSSLHYPTDKPKKASAKKAAITKPEPHIPGAETGETNGQAAPGAVSGNGYGLRFGTGVGGTGTGSGVGGSGSGAGGGGGGDPFGVEGFPFTYYLQMVSDKISGNWFTSMSDPSLGGQLQTQIYFRIFRTGQVADVKVEVSSGAQTFDLSAMRAIQTAAPFPALPAEYDGQFLGIHLIFEHAK